MPRRTRSSGALLGFGRMSSPASFGTAAGRSAAAGGLAASGLAGATPPGKSSSKRLPSDSVPVAGAAAETADANIAVATATRTSSKQACRIGRSSHSPGYRLTLAVLFIIALDHFADQLSKAALFGRNGLVFTVELGPLLVGGVALHRIEPLLKLPGPLVQFYLQSADHFHFEQLESGPFLWLLAWLPRAASSTIRLLPRLGGRL